MGISRIRQKGKLWIYVFSLLLVLCAACYVAEWPQNMESVQMLRNGLKEQNEERWLKAFYREPECFPVRRPDLPRGSGQETSQDSVWGFENGYGEGRSYGGSRRHEGIDIMSQSGKRGELLVQSVSDGVVEQMGWLELGGYRIGIRSASGLYYYYAHLDSYEADLKKGDKVRAGQSLGRMGDSGYGEEGTRGRFAVHLHFGIYYNDGEEEKSLNPYYLLRFLEQRNEAAE